MAKYNVGDKINFLEYEYELVNPHRNGFWWSTRGGGVDNGAIFDYILLDKKQFSHKVLGYSRSGDFPELKTLEDVEKLTDALLLECAKFRYSVGTRINDEGSEFPVTISDHYWCRNTTQIWNGNGFGRLYVNGKWAEVVSEEKEFVLPEKWCVSLNSDTRDTLNKWGRETFTNWGDIKSNDYMCSDYPFENKIDAIVTSGGNWDGEFTEITFEQFKKYVLKEEPVQPVKQSNFEVGKWYTFYTKNKEYHLIAKCNGVEKGYFLFTDKWCISNLVKKKADKIDLRYMIEPKPLTDLSEIQQYLPDGHVDKISTKPNFDDCKIWIGDNPELSKKVQEKLFELGYSWGGRKKVERPDFKALFVINTVLYNANKEETFNGQEQKEIFPADLGIITVEEGFKVGDFVITEGYSENYDGRILQITQIKEEFCYFKILDGGYYNKRDNFVIEDILRKARPEEIPTELGSGVLKQMEGVTEVGYDRLDIQTLHSFLEHLQPAPYTSQYIWGIDPVGNPLHHSRGLVIDYSLGNFAEPKTILSIDDDELPMARPRGEVKVTRLVSLDD